ncbi:unnamed protein product, partial [Scytosiphon promiscuus]
DIYPLTKFPGKMGRCSHASCTRQPKYNVMGSKAAYCKQHASDGMVDV